MELIGAFEAKTHLAQLLDRVQAGEEITITRHGEPVAKLVPIAAAAGANARQAVEGLRQLRQGISRRGVKVTAAEVRSWITEGRR